jgi:hypothetical protein
MARDRSPLKPARARQRGVARVWRLGAALWRRVLPAAWKARAVNDPAETTMHSPSL